MPNTALNLGHPCGESGRAAAREAWISSAGPVGATLPLQEAGWRCCPPLALLQSSAAARHRAPAPSHEALEGGARLLIKVLNDYGVKGTIR